MKWLLNHKTHGDKPWAVQTEAMRRSEGRAKYAYLLQQGLGKSSLTFNYYLNDDAVDLCVVLCPSSFRGDWVTLPGEWGRPDVPGWVGPKAAVPFKEEIGVYALNFEGARSEIRHDLYELLDKRRCLLVIDEATSIKNPTSKVSKGVLELAKRATRVRLLNGTPLTQNVMDYYSQLRCVGELNGVNPYAFRNTYGEFGGFMGKQIVGIKDDKKDQLGRLLDRCSFRALKTEWRKDLPPQITVDPVHVEMTDKQRRHYADMMEDFYTQVNGLDVEAELVLTQMDKCRQISGGVVMSHGEVRWIDDPSANPKALAAFDIHDDGPGKSIIVHHYKATGELLFDLATKRKLRPAVIRGGMDSDELLEEKRRFNDDPACRVLIGQEAAACRGHTLIGGEGSDSCCKTIYFEQSFAYWQRAQMDDRNHRGAQGAPCNIYDIATSPMDLVAIAIINGKRDLAAGMDDIVRLVRERRWRT